MCQHTLDSLAEWFLRLNGFFTVLNFVVHPVERTEASQQRTDADVLGVRFPGRQEIIGDEKLRDHARFNDSSRLHLVIAEVKAGGCKLNGPWIRPEHENVDHVIRSLGCVEDKLRGSVSRSLYDTGRYEGDTFEATLLCFGSRTSTKLSMGVAQFTWTEVFGFVYDRYQEFWKRKRQHQQWPPVGRLLWDRCHGRTRDAYIREMIAVFDVAAA